MEFWESTKKRSITTLTVWEQHFSTLNIGIKTSASLDSLVYGFEPLASACVAAQDTFDEAFRAVQGALATMRVLGTKVPQIIEGHLDEDMVLMRDVKNLYATSPRTEATILKRLRELLPVWTRANVAMAALSPTQPPIVRMVGGVAYTATSAKALLDSFTNLVEQRGVKDGLLSEAKEALMAHALTADELNKRFYKVAKAMSDAGTPEANALESIPTEEGTPAPVVVEISTMTQGGEDGMHTVVNWVKGGGNHATTLNLRWKVEGVDADFSHSVELDRAGNTIGPFKVGEVVRAMGEVINSTGRRTTAVRTLTIGAPIV
jgi:hypothetical protein